MSPRLAQLAVALLAWGCSKRSAGPPVREDLAELSSYVHLPKGVTSARWLVRGFPSTARSLPNPDGIPARGLAYLTVAPGFWSGEGATLASADVLQHKFVESDARALFPVALVASGSPREGWLQLTCVGVATAPLDARARVTEAMRCGDGLVLAFNIR